MRTPHFQIDDTLFKAALKYSLVELDKPNTKEEKRVVALHLVGALSSVSAGVLTEVVIDKRKGSAMTTTRSDVN